MKKIKTLFLRVIVNFPQAISICHKNTLNNMSDSSIEVTALKTRTQNIKNKHIKTINIPSNFLLRNFTSTVIELFYSLKTDLMIGVGNIRELPIVYFAKLFNPKSKYLLEIHTCYERVQKNTKKGILKKIEHRVFGHLIKKSDKIITVSNFTRQGFVKGFGIPLNKMEVVHNSLNTSLFSKKNRDLKKLKGMFKINNTNKNILYVGKLSKTKSN